MKDGVSNRLPVGRLLGNEARLTSVFPHLLADHERILLSKSKELKHGQYLLLIDPSSVRRKLA